jgi:probable HAF family extracellular repeat protein
MTMTDNIRKHILFALALAAMIWGASPLFAQGKLVGRRVGSGKVSLRSAASEPDIPATLSAGNFGTIDFPGAADSVAYSINDHGDFVGGYGPDTESDFSDIGFYLAHDAFKQISYPGAIQTGAFGVNNSGEIVGSYVDSSNNLHGFQLVKGVYTSIDVPGASLTQVDGVSDSGEIVGLYYTPGSSTGYSFYLVGSTYTTIAVAGAVDTYAGAVNSAGQIVGQYIDTSGNYHGFLWQSGTFTTIDYPGAVYSSLLAINEQGDVAGEYGDGVSFFEGFQHGYVYSKGQYLNVDAPFVGNASTWIYGINKFGVIAGGYSDSSGRSYGFTATVSGL